MILNRLLDKNLIKETGTVRSGRTYARLFNVTISMEEFLSDKLKNDTAYKCDKGRHLTGIFDLLLQDPDIDLNILNQLEDIVNKRKAGFKQV